MTLNIRFLSGNIFLTIDIPQIPGNEVYTPKTMNYEEIKILFELNILTEQYYMLINNDENIYTNLYDIYEMKYKQNIILNNLNIIFLPYNKNDVDKIKNVQFGFGFTNDIDIFPNDDLKSDKLFVLMAVNNCGKNYKYISKELQEDKQIIINAAFSERYRYECLNYMPQKYKKDKDFIKYFLNHNVHNIRFASDNLKNDLELVNFVINKSGSVLQYLNDLYKDNEEIVRIAINNYPNCFEYISERLRNKKEIIIECIEILKSSPEKYNNIIRFISEEHQNDKEIVLPLVELCGDNLQYASDKLKKDKDVVYAAIKNDAEAFIHADELFFKDKEFILLCLHPKGYDEEYYEDFLEDLSDNFKDDKEIVLACVKKCGNNFKYASNRLKNDKDVVLEAIDNCYYDFYEKMSDKDKLEYIAKRNINIDNIINDTELKDDSSILKQIIKKIKIN